MKFMTGRRHFFDFSAQTCSQTWFTFKMVLSKPEVMASGLSCYSYPTVGRKQSTSIVPQQMLPIFLLHRAPSGLDASTL